MLIRITNQCNQTCSHCFHENVGPKADHMTREIFDQTIEFVRRIGARVLLLTGGEPTLNPRLFDFLRSVHTGEFVLGITSNGSFAARPKFTKELMKLCDRKRVSIQVTNDPRFYPNPLPKSDIWKKLEVVDRVPMIYPCRRVSENGHRVTRTSPGCFNLRSLSRRHSFSKSVQLLEMALHRFCTPAVGVNGRVYMGEADTCTFIGTVGSTPRELDTAIVRATCDRCGLIGALPIEYRAAVGELQL